MREDAISQPDAAPAQTAPPSTDCPAPSPHALGGLASRSFLGLLVTQFLGAMNDNMIRWLIVPIGKELVGPEHEKLPLSAGAIAFVLPYILFAAPAGYLADRFSKRAVIAGCKLAEVFIMVLGVAAILYGDLYIMLGLLFLMGTHSAMFGPAKYGAIPELVRPDRLSAANGLIGMTTIAAIVAGTVLGNFLYYWTRPLGQSDWWISASVLLGVAAAGLTSSLVIRPMRQANPARRFPVNMFQGTYRDMATLMRNRPLFLAALGTTTFWSLGALVQLNVDQFGTRCLDLQQQHIGPLLAILAVGVGVGNVLAGIWSKGRIELGIVPWGALGMAAGGFLLSTVPSAHGNTWSAGYMLSAAWLFVLGFGAGMYDVPLQAFLQHRSDESSRGSVLAATNFITFSGMMLASGLFYLLGGWLKLSAKEIFFLAGIALLPVVVGVVWMIPVQSVRFLCWMLSKVFYRVKVIGLENLPQRGGVLLVSNHVSWIDGIMLLVYSPRPIRMIALTDYIKGWWVRGLAQRTGVIPIRPENRRSVLEMVRTAREALRAGEVVCIFPEGGLTRTGHLQAFHAGFLSILKDTQGALVPVYLGGFWGSIFSYFGGKFFWKRPRQVPYPLSIRFGPPIHPVQNVRQVRSVIEQMGIPSVDEQKQYEKTLPRLFLRTCRRNMRRSKVADTFGVDLTGAGLLARTLVFRRLLRRSILADDEKHVGVLLPPSVAGVVTNAALAVDGRVAVNLNYTVSSEVMNDCIKQCDIRHVLASRRMLERFPLNLEANLVCLEDFKHQVSLWDKIVAAAATWLVPVVILERLLGLTRIQPDDVAAVIFTSGSTGHPKGVMLTQYNIASNITSFSQVIDLRASDVLLGVLPFFHSFGFTVTLWTILALDPKGAYHYSPLEPRQIGQLCRQQKVTLLLVAPTFLRSFVRRCEPEDFASLEVVITGAEKLPPQLADDFEAKFKIRPLEGYGTTELSPVVAANIPACRWRSEMHRGQKEGSVGQPIPGVMAKITDLDTGETLEPGRPGMLWIRGPNVMKGYLGLPELTAEVVRDGWYMTGDVAVVDEEGFIHITGRESRFSKIGGEMVPHIGVEEVLAKIVARGQEDDEIRVAVTSVPDVKKGERLIVLHTGLNMPAEQICRALAEQGVPPLWVPSIDSYYQIDAIPMLGTGKLDLKALRRLAEEKTMATA